MRLDLYQAECERIAQEKMMLLNEARNRISNQQPLSKLEQSGLLHVIQVLIENAIGKSKHLLKLHGETVPVSAYDAFASLSRAKLISETALTEWNAAIGLRNRIVHDYMNIDLNLVYALLTDQKLDFIADFLLKKF
ncbi:type VII toxin-antitoxin system HepT family RNase toxin [Methylophilus aquaticus]|uniref:DUF86 domain-containing protein n=1 Tax=Methylophilus aquaticus TaxID=1971610 RepID=A0ABT9JU65_9PROT|nr:DUF86 domain-containing protein [Methylophilus aquaticus]MDP8568069.1 DUF86 domain-containing protein [Methylophilus aquaticus]